MQRFYPRLRLHAVLRGRSGITIEQAIGRASTEMEAWADEAFQIVDEAIAELRRLCGPGAGVLCGEEVYRQAETVVNLAGLYSPALCKAAQSLCDLAHNATPAHPLDRKAVAVHAESMVLLRSLGDEENATTALVLEGLNAVVAKKR